MNTEQQYRQALAGHDWYYDYSDDHSVWARGKSEREALRDMRKHIDADGKIWNEYAPDDFKMTN
jgi:hypothetical protein